MIPGAIVILVVLALALTLIHGTTTPAKPPLWIAVLLLCLVHLIMLAGK